MLRTFSTRGLAPACLALASLTLTCLLLPLAALAEETLEDQAIAWLQEYVRIDTINPPGNESRAVDFLGAILTAEGIPWQSAESSEGRGNLWARLEGGDEPALILLQHTDVVPADPKYWTTDPLSGELRDGYIWGRGTLDMKGTGIHVHGNVHDVLDEGPESLELHGIQRMEISPASQEQLGKLCIATDARIDGRAPYRAAPFRAALRRQLFLLGRTDV